MLTCQHTPRALALQNGDIMFKKIFFAVILLTAVIVGGTGCMRTKQIITNEPKSNANELALAYMEEKYGESFTFLAPWGNSMSGNREILVTCESLPEEQILVQVENYKTDEAIYRDNYLAVKYQDEVIDFFKTTAAEFFGDINVFYTPSKQCVSADLPADAAFTAFYADSSTIIPVMLEISASRFSDASAIESYLNTISDTQGEISVSFVIVEDEVFGSLDRKGLSDLITMKNAVYSAYGAIVNGAVQMD